MPAAASGVELGTRVHLRDVATLDELGDVPVPAPVEPGDLVASEQETFRIEVVLVTPPGAAVVAVLVRRVELTVAAR